MCKIHGNQLEKGYPYGFESSIEKGIEQTK